MSWKRIALTLGIIVSDSTLYRRRQELGRHESFVDICYEELYTVIMGMLTQTPYAGESYYVSGGLRARGICLGNGMICGDIWHKYHSGYFKIVT